jgi:hypothetical protein
MQQVCAYFDVDIVPEEIYFLQNPKSYDLESGTVFPTFWIYDIEVVKYPINPGADLGDPDYTPRLLPNSSRGEAPNFNHPSGIVGTCSIEENIYVVYTLESKLQVARYPRWRRSGSMPWEVRRHRIPWQAVLLPW